MVTVLFQTESRYPTARKKIVAAIQSHLLGKIRRPAEISVTIIGDRRMRQLNRQYRQLDETTDVLSFPLHDSSQRSEISFIDAPDDVLRLGDIAVSFPQAVREAGEDNMLVDDKIVFLVLHGLDHLLGIHHPE